MWRAAVGSWDELVGAGRERWRRTDSYEEIAEIGEDVGCLEGLWWVGGRHVE